MIRMSLQISKHHETEDQKHDKSWMRRKKRSIGHRYRIKREITEQQDTQLISESNLPITASNVTTQNTAIPSKAQTSSLESTVSLVDTSIKSDTMRKNGENTSKVVDSAYKLIRTDISNVFPRAEKLKLKSTTPITFTVTATRPPTLQRPSTSPDEQLTSNGPSSKSVPNNDEEHKQSNNSTTVFQKLVDISSHSSTTNSSLQPSIFPLSQASPSLPILSTLQTNTDQHSQWISNNVPSKNDTSLTTTISTSTTKLTTLSSSQKPVTYNFIYKRLTPPPSSTIKPSTTQSSTQSSSTATSKQTVKSTASSNGSLSSSKKRRPFVPATAPTYDVIPPPVINAELPVDYVSTPTATNNNATMLPSHDMTSGIGSGIEIGIAAGSIVAFWLLLGPIVCLICRIRERRAAKVRGSGTSVGTTGSPNGSGDDELGHRLVEEMIRLELARGRHKLYRTNVQDEHEIERLGGANENNISDYINTEFLHNIVRNDYAKNSMDRHDSCEKFPPQTLLSNGTIPQEPLYANTTPTANPVSPQPDVTSDTVVYANTTSKEPDGKVVLPLREPHCTPPPPPPPPPSVSNGYVCSNNYPLSSRAFRFGGRKNKSIVPNHALIRSPESEPVDGFMYSPRLLQRQLEKNVKTDQKVLPRSEKIYPKDNQVHPKENTYSNIQMIEQECKVDKITKQSADKLLKNTPIQHSNNTAPKTKNGFFPKDGVILNGYSRLPNTSLPKLPLAKNVHNGSLGRSTSMHENKDLTSSMDKAIQLINGEKYRITSSNPSIDSEKYMICNKQSSKPSIPIDERLRNGIRKYETSHDDKTNTGSDPWLRRSIEDNQKNRDRDNNVLSGNNHISGMTHRNNSTSTSSNDESDHIINHYSDTNDDEEEIDSLDGHISPVQSTITCNSAPLPKSKSMNSEDPNKRLRTQGTQTLETSSAIMTSASVIGVGIHHSPWLGYHRRPGVKDTVV